MFLKDLSETLEISPWKCSLDSKEHLSVINIEEEPSDLSKLAWTVTFLTWCLIELILLH